VKYYTINNSMGYDGDLELALIPENFRTDVLKETLDDNKVLLENSNAETGSFALLFEFDGDVKKIRHVLYNCAASRPSIGGKTNEEEKEVQTETISVKARPLPNGYVKAKTGDQTAASVYNGWYNQVYMPGSAEADVSLSALTIGNLSLVPEFDADVVAYTTTTSNATNAVTAVANDASATVDITANGTAIESGDSVTWNAGANSVILTVTNGSASRQYAVTVVKS
ncbi:MAG: cadherin-like beta sandwich domain-containing protein, partial [Pseudobutyrivibrio sp.]|nr:cadherin-like beta sandwich domain-containing protein [Pseudobutyrivibrio sp.]